MSRRGQFDRKKLEQFLHTWEPLLKKSREARRAAVEAMGETMKRELDAQIRTADLESDAKETVVSWQTIRLGSEGGYAAVKPLAKKWSYNHGQGDPKFWKGIRVSTRMVTKWLEKGHGARQADPTKAYFWSRSRRNRDHSAPFNDRTGKQYIQGRMFYSWANLKARDIALRAASRALERIGDEVDY